MDFRAAPSDSPEGKGVARRAWDGYAKRVKVVAESPVLEPAIRWYAVRMVSDLTGFWVAWHLYGGFEGLVELGMHPSTVWRKVKKFREAFGAHPDEFTMPGVTVDPEAYWDFVRGEAERRQVPISNYKTARKQKQ